MFPLGFVCNHWLTRRRGTGKAPARVWKTRSVADFSNFCGAQAAKPAAVNRKARPMRIARVLIPAALLALTAVSSCTALRALAAEPAAALDTMDKVQGKNLSSLPRTG
ncbi:MAG: hypothetical protein ACKOOL_04270 [Novosphingobium sp.]